MFTKLDLCLNGLDRTVWVTADETMAIRYDAGNTKPYSIMVMDQDGSYRKVGASRELIKAQRSICHRMNIPIPEELEYQNQVQPFNPPKLRVVTNGVPESPGIAAIRRNIKAYRERRNNRG